MMKFFTATIAAWLAAGAAHAGALTYTPPIATVIEEPQRMGGSGAWLIPLIIIAVVALAITQTAPNDRIIDT